MFALAICVPGCAFGEAGSLSGPCVERSHPPQPRACRIHPNLELITDAAVRPSWESEARLEVADL